MNTRLLTVTENGKTTLADRSRKATEVVRPVLEQIDQAFAEAERRIRALQPTIDAWVRCRPYAIRSLGSSQCIGVAQVGNEWRLCYGTASCWGEASKLEVSSSSPITEASPIIRVDIATHFPTLYPALLERVVEAMEDFVPEAENALAKMVGTLKESKCPVSAMCETHFFLGGSEPGGLTSVSRNAGGQRTRSRDRARTGVEKRRDRVVCRAKRLAEAR
jgi:hypothetical protein